METLALHDRRTEDLPGVNSGDHDEFDGTSNDKYKDPDMDQRWWRGSLFVEVYNPWSAQGQYPAELYTKLDKVTNYLPSTVPQQEGVELGRLSNFADDNGMLSTKASDAATGVKRSPIWRMIVVEDWPEERNRDSVDDARNDVKRKTAKPPAGYKSMEKAMNAWKPTDPTPPPYHAPIPTSQKHLTPRFCPRVSLAKRINSTSTIHI